MAFMPVEGRLCIAVVCLQAAGGGCVHSEGCRFNSCTARLLQVRRNSSLCAAPLLTHPLTQQRLRRLHRVMRVLLMVLPSGTLLLQGGHALVPCRA